MGWGFLSPRRGMRGLLVPFLTLAASSTALGAFSPAYAQEAVPDAAAPVNPTRGQIQIPSAQKRVALNADDCLRRAVVFVRVGDYSRAVDSLSVAIKLRPDIANLLRNRGMTYLQIAGAERRVQMYSLSLVRQPQSAGLYLRRGMAYYNTGEYTKAITDCDAALTRFPDYAAAYLTRALAHDAAGHPVEAAADYEHAFELLPGYRPVSLPDFNDRLL